MFSKTGHLALGPIKDLLLDMAEAREAEAIPSLVLRRLVDSSESLVLAGVWLLGPAGGTEWLDLAATAGTAPLDLAQEGAIRRVPATAFDIGRLTAAADPIVVPRPSFDMPAAILHWADGREIAGFWGQRVAWRGTTFGAIGAFSTTTPTRSDDDVLRLVASQLAAAIARERASHELHELRERLAADGNGVSARSAKAVLSEEDVRRFERENIVAALEATRGRIYGRGGAAELLGLKPTTLASRLKKLGISARP
jgi:transcriptional regulator with GAF, ATPase, and Fis domain